MSEDAAIAVDDRSYGELLGEYFTVVAEIAPMLGEFGQPERDQHEEYARLRARKEALQSALAEEAPDHEATDVEAVLDEALSDQ